MNLSNKLDTSNIENFGDVFDPRELLFRPVGGSYWETSECPAGFDGTSRLKEMRNFIDTDVRSVLGPIPFVGDPLVDFIVAKMGPYPDYGSDGERVCNKRPLAEPGRYLIHRILDHGMILEVDHLSTTTLVDTLELLEDRNYPGVISGHNWIENNDEIRRRIFDLGGMMSPLSGSASGTIDRLVANITDRRAAGEAGVAPIGTDTQGIASQASPGDATISYPFDSIDGTVTFLPPSTGNRQFDFNREGVAQYGMMAEWVEALRQADAAHPEDVMTAFMSSAEAYVQMWERAEAQAAQGR